LHLHGPGEIEFLGFGLRCLVPFLENLGESRSIDFNKLLKLVEIVAKLLKAFF
jgi:hypothetical protein